MPLPEFAGSAMALESEEDEPDFVDVFVVEADELCARTLGAVASACAASTPTPTSAAIVIISTENVAPRPDFGRPDACRASDRVGVDGGGAAARRPPAPPPDLAESGGDTGACLPAE